MTNRSVLLKADGLLLNHYINRLPLTLEELERIAHDMDWLLDTYQEATDFISRAGIADFVKEQSLCHDIRRAGSNPLRRTAPIFGEVAVHMSRNGAYRFTAHYRKRSDRAVR